MPALVLTCAAARFLHALRVEKRNAPLHISLLEGAQVERVPQLPGFVPERKAALHFCHACQGFAAQVQWTNNKPLGDM